MDDIRLCNIRKCNIHLSNQRLSMLWVFNNSLLMSWVGGIFKRSKHVWLNLWSIVGFCWDLFSFVLFNYLSWLLLKADMFVCFVLVNNWQVVMQLHHIIVCNIYFALRIPKFFKLSHFLLITQIPHRCVESSFIHVHKITEAAGFWHL